MGARSQPIMGYTLMAAQAGQQPTRIFTLMTTLRGPPERWRLAHVGCSEPAYNGIYSNGCPNRSTTYTAFYPDDDPSEGLLKDGGLPTLDAQSQPIMGYTLMAVRAGQPPIWVITLMATLRGLPERQRLAHVRCSELTYNGIYPDGRLSRPTAYMGPFGGFLKDRSSPTLDVQSQPIMGYILMASRAGQLPTWVFPPAGDPREA